MYLELELFDMPSRTRRNANSPQVCQAGSNDTKCCLYDLMIDFEKVGWDFVSRPHGPGVNFYLFSGHCPKTIQRICLPRKLPSICKFQIKTFLYCYNLGWK